MYAKEEQPWDRLQFDRPQPSKHIRHGWLLRTIIAWNALSLPILPHNIRRRADRRNTQSCNFSPFLLSLICFPSSVYPCILQGEEVVVVVVALLLHEESVCVQGLVRLARPGLRSIVAM